MILSGLSIRHLQYAWVGTGCHNVELFRMLVRIIYFSLWSALKTTDDLQYTYKVIGSESNSVQTLCIFITEFPLSGINRCCSNKPGRTSTLHTALRDGDHSYKQWTYTCSSKKRACITTAWCHYLEQKRCGNSSSTLEQQGSLYGRRLNRNKVGQRAIKRCNTTNYM